MSRRRSPRLKAKKGRRRSRSQPEMLSRSNGSTFRRGKFNNIGHDMLSIVIQIGDINVPNKSSVEVCLHRLRLSLNFCPNS